MAKSYGPTMCGIKLSPSKVKKISENIIEDIGDCSRGRLECKTVKNRTNSPRNFSARKSLFTDSSAQKKGQKNNGKEIKAQSSTVTESRPSSIDNVIYSPSIKRRPGKFFKKVETPEKLVKTSPQKSHRYYPSPNKNKSPKVKVGSPRFKTGESPQGQKKITEFFSEKPSLANIVETRSEIVQTAPYENMNCSPRKFGTVLFREETATTSSIKLPTVKKSGRSLSLKSQKCKDGEGLKKQEHFGHRAQKSVTASPVEPILTSVVDLTSDTETLSEDSKEVKLSTPPKPDEGRDSVRKLGSGSQVRRNILSPVVDLTSDDTKLLRKGDKPTPVKADGVPSSCSKETVSPSLKRSLEHGDTGGSKIKVRCTRTASPMKATPAVCRMVSDGKETISTERSSKQEVMTTEEVDKNDVDPPAPLGTNLNHRKGTKKDRQSLSLRGKSKLPMKSFKVEIPEDSETSHEVVIPSPDEVVIPSPDEVVIPSPDKVVIPSPDKVVIPSPDEVVVSPPEEVEKELEGIDWEETDFEAIRGVSCADTTVPGEGIEKTAEDPPKVGPVQKAPTPKKSPKKQAEALHVSGGLINYLFTAKSTELAFLEQKLFVEEDVAIGIRYNAMDRQEQDLYVKLFSRIPEWLREEKMNYPFIKDLTSSLNILEYNGFITTKIEDEPLEVILNILQLGEMKKVCKKLKVTMKGKQGTKKEMFNALLQMANSQNTLQYFSTSRNMGDLIKNSVRQELKTCVKLEEGPRNLFNLLLILATYAHFLGDEKDRIRDLGDRLYKLRTMTVEYPKFVCRASPVFLSIEQLKEYQSSLNFCAQLYGFIEVKNWCKARELVLLAKNKLEEFLKDEQSKQLLKELPSFLWKFTSGCKYCGAVSKGITVLKKEKGVDQVVLECLDLLLSQNNFHAKRRGTWYEEKAIIYESRLKDLNKVYESLVNGLLDESVDPISKRALSHRAEKLMKRKTSLICDAKKDFLKDLLVSVPFTPTIVTIEAKSVPSSGPGLKQTFVRTFADVTEYSSVEETVMAHYRERPDDSFNKGLHDEGKTIKNIALACFWDVIYSEPEGIGDHSVFHSPMQKNPLDWGSVGFFKRREKAILSKADFMKSHGLESVMMVLTELCEGNYGAAGIVEWELLNLGMLSKTEELIRCIGVDVFVNIAVHLLKNYRLYHSGFPDLTLWDPDTDKCVIVEVKGPKDTLSDSQLYWLENLKSFGARAEVCKVETQESSKSRKR